MSCIRILTEADLRRLVPLDAAAVACVEDAFRALAGGTVVMPPILRLDIPAHRGEVDVKTAYLPGLDGFAIKISPGFFGNPTLGLPSTNGLMVLLNARTGIVDSLLLDNGYLTDVRTAAAGAVAAKYLARADASVAAILGAGAQARLQLQALVLVRPIWQARIWARRADRAEAMAAEMQAQLGFPVTACADAEAAVRDADIIVTTTPATAPVLQAQWLAPGQHVTAMGSDAEHKNELDPRILTRADRYIADSAAQARRFGELHHAIAAGLVAADAPCSELGPLVAGSGAGRDSAAALTICDLTGTGAQDTAIATLAARRAEETGTGMRFET